MSCTILAHVKTSDGEVVESKLFNDLNHYLGDRSLAKEYYKVGTDQTFLDKVKDKAEFDENGEITFRSLQKLAKIKIGKSKIFEALERELRVGSYASYDAAIERVQNFNRNSAYRDKYLATITLENGKYKISVVENTRSERNKLEDFIENRCLRDKIIYRLKKNGVSVDFIEEDEGIDGRYSTINARKTAEGYYALISVAKGEKLTKALAEEAGHFALGALGKNHPLVRKLMAHLTPEVKAHLIEKYGLDKNLGTSSDREFAGTLIGEAIYSEEHDLTYTGRLLQRIIDFVKKMKAFVKGEDTTMVDDLAEARRAARKIAAGFMSDNFEGDITNALDTKETLFSGKVTGTVKAYKSVIERLTDTLNKLRSITPETAVSGSTLTEVMKNLQGTVEQGRSSAIARLTATSSGTGLATNIAFEGILDTVEQLADLMGPGKEIDALLKSVVGQKAIDLSTVIINDTKALREVRTFVNSLGYIINTIEDAINDGTLTSGSAITASGVSPLHNLKTMLRDLKEAYGIVDGQLRQKEVEVSVRFLSETYGRKAITMAAKVVFKKGSILTEKREASEVETKTAIEQNLAELPDDISLLDRFLKSAANCSDIIIQIADKAVKQANKEADDITMDAAMKMNDLMAELERDFKIDDTSILFETTDRFLDPRYKDKHKKYGKEGVYTGNLIGEYNAGDWEQDYAEFRAECIEQFKADHAAELDMWGDIERGWEWDKFFHPKIKQWHRAHSVKGADGYRPNDSYRNAKYDELKAKYPGIDTWLKKYADLKAQLDNRYPTGAVASTNTRLPQFKSRGFLEKVRTRYRNRGFLEALGGAIRSSFLELFCESSEDTDFGCDATYNREEPIFNDTMVMRDKEGLKRLPMFGINKLEDMDDLSTDLFASTVAYASAAASYAASNTIVGALEVTAEVLNRRKVASIYSEKERRGNAGRAYNRYLRYLDKQVYGVSFKKHKLGNFVFEKLVSQLTRLAAFHYLGGNVLGGLVNTGTGTIEVFKEAVASEYYGVKDWGWANKVYFSPRHLGAGLVGTVSNIGKEKGTDMISLIQEKFNILQKNKINYREIRTDRWRLTKMLGEAAYWPYSSGEHYMQTIPYLAVGHATKLYYIDSSGDVVETHLLDALTPEGNGLGKKLTYKKTGLNDAAAEGTDGNVYFRSKEDVDKYHTANSLITDIELALSSPILGALTLTTSQQDLLDELGITDPYTDLRKTKGQLIQAKKKMVWNSEDETNFMNQVREVNNRLHGIYNKIDSVAFTQNWFGNALVAMRGWFLGMFERRFSGGHYSVALGRDVEGSLITTSKVLMSAISRSDFKLVKGQYSALRFLVCPFGKEALEKFKALGFSENQFRNLRRSLMDYTFILILALLKFASTKPPKDDDDEEENQTMGLVNYFSTRLFREQSALNTPWGLIEETKNTVMDLTPVGGAILYDLVKLSKLTLGAAIYDEDDKDFYYQKDDPRGRWRKHEAKAEYEWCKWIPYYTSFEKWEHPYAAIEAYEYGTTVKQK